MLSGLSIEFPTPRGTLVNNRLIASAVLIALIAGCAANPYSKVAPAAAGQNLTAEEALRYSNNAMEDFRAKRSAEFDRQQGLSSSLFLLGAGTLGLAAYGAHKDAIGATALVGATAYQMGNWNTNTARNALYGEGINALACAQAVMAPVLFEKVAREPVEGKITDVKKAWTAAALASGEIYNFSMSNSLAPEVRTALQAERAAADKQFNRADRAVARAEQYLALSKRAPADLKVHVDFVRESVDQAVNITAADIQKLPESIARLADYSTFFASLQAPGSSESSGPAPAGKGTLPMPTTQSGAASEKAAGAGTSMIAKLIADTNTLRAAVTALDNSYGKTSSSAVKADIAKCKIDASSTALQLVPDTLDLVAGVASDSIIDIPGSTGFYRVSPVTTTENSPTVVQPQANTFSVKSSDKTPTGTYLMRVEDQTRRSAMLTVRVVAKPVEAASSSPNGKNKENACVHIGRSQAEICLLQQVLGVGMDGDFGKNTCTAFRSNPLTSTRNDLFDGPALAAIKERSGLAKDAGEADIKGKLQKTCPASPAATSVAAFSVTTRGGSAPQATDKSCAARKTQNDFECAMTVEQVKELRSKMKLQPTPIEFDQPLRERLAVFQKEKNLMPRNGVYTPQTKAQLFAN